MCFILTVLGGCVFVSKVYSLNLFALYFIRIRSDFQELDFIAQTDLFAYFFEFRSNARRNCGFAECAPDRAGGKAKH